MNRYSYVFNSPIIYTDPSGHKICDYKCQIEYERADPEYEHYGEGLSCWGLQECYGIKPKTVIAKALSGDIPAIINFIIPTTFGVRAQAEYVPKSPICILAYCMPLSVSGGVNAVFNRVDGVISASIDVAPEVGPAFQPEPLVPDFSITAGPILTWGSSQAEQVTTGDSYVTSGTLAAGRAYSVALIVPGNPLPDPVYGVRPFTLYAGVFGVGTGYASGGTGISRTVFEQSFNLKDLFSYDN